MAKSLFDIQDKVIIVTGAAGVLAGCTTRYMLSQGAHVVLLDLNQDKVDSLVNEYRSTISDKVSGYACNVLDREMLEGVYEKIMADRGRIDVLINGAGGNMAGAMIKPDQTIFDLNLEQYGKVLDLNLKGTLYPSITFVKAMVQQKAGVIVNFSSMAAFQAISQGIGYSNAKGAINNLTRWLACEFGRTYGQSIRVNAIAPGFFIGNQNRALLCNPDGTYTARGNAVIKRTPMGRFGTEDEVCGCIHYLICDASKFVTGAIIPVDGGFSAFSGI